MAGHLPATSDNGLVRSKLPPAAPKPVFPVNPSTELKRPQGVFPKPPPSHRVGAKPPEAKEDPKPPVNDSENIRRVKLTGELLQNKMLQHLEKKPQSLPRLQLPSQKSVSEVAPLRKPIPNVGLRPTKPKRPPSVSLDRFRVKGLALQPTVHQDTKTLEGKYIWFALIAHGDVCLTCHWGECEGQYALMFVIMIYWEYIGDMNNRINRRLGGDAAGCLLCCQWKHRLVTGGLLCCGRPFCWQGLGPFIQQGTLEQHVIQRCPAPSAKLIKGLFVCFLGECHSFL